ncbi:hypothetical protein M5K25_019947 [Dendrobium thyrsiflorum]|uniref:Uncharacterized protein n=1 Tax=Dendrobium thyrsiflorum TaxID=117978 RepID=A0ABD0UGK4_DENTH
MEEQGERYEGRHIFCTFFDNHHSLLIVSFHRVHRTLHSSNWTTARNHIPHKNHHECHQCTTNKTKQPCHDIHPTVIISLMNAGSIFGSHQVCTRIQRLRMHKELEGFPVKDLSGADHSNGRIFNHGIAVENYSGVQDAHGLDLGFEESRSIAFRMGSTHHGHYCGCHFSFCNGKV